jgi:Domain of unknown function (DUF3885)
MELEDEFDLKSALDKLFPNLSLGGEILHQGPFGVKFEIGLTRIDRAVMIFNGVFQQAEEVVLLSEDLSWQADTKRWYELFALPGLPHSSERPKVRSYKVHVSEEEDYVVQWAIIRPSAVSTERLFQAIANQDHGLTPSVRGRVHIVDPGAEVLLHMYDDRGMDVIAKSAAPLQTLEEVVSFMDHQGKARWTQQAGLVGSTPGGPPSASYRKSDFAG